MRVTNLEKLKMCEGHVLRGKSLSQVSEENGNFDIAILKYHINLYKRHGREVFVDRVNRGKYRRDSKLLAIGRVKAGESIRSVAIDLGLIDPNILGDWVRMHDRQGPDAIKDTFPRNNYMLKDERFKHKLNQSLLEENERLKAEIDYLKKSRSLTRNLEGVTAKQKSEIVTELRKQYRLQVLLDITGMASSVYYYHVAASRQIVNRYEALEKEIDDIYLKKHRRRLGYHRIHIELRNRGWKVGNNKVLDIMRAKGYLKTKAKKWRRYNAYEGDLGGVKANVMQQNFKTEKPYEKAGTDITMFGLDEEAVYFSPIVDFDSREVLAYSVGTDAKMEKIMEMLGKLKRDHGRHIRGMMMQSDQGVQYQNSRYRERLKAYGIIQSMSRKGNCLDNSPTENLFGRMKEEMWYGHEGEYRSPDELIKAIDEYVDYYNNQRIVTKLRTTPTSYRKNQQKTL
jgi:transposase InsO family protein/transposase-like protein